MLALTLSDDHAVQQTNWFDVPHWEQSGGGDSRAGRDEASVGQG